MTQRDWITSPSPREPQHRVDPDQERPWWADEEEAAFADYPRPDLIPAPFTCRCQCGCVNLVANGLFCANCDPNGLWRNL